MKTTTDQITYNKNVSTTTNISDYIYDYNSTGNGGYITTDNTIVNNPCVDGSGGWDYYRVNQDPGEKDAVNYDYYELGFFTLKISKLPNHTCSVTGIKGYLLGINGQNSVISEEDMVKFANKFIGKKKIELI